MLEPLKLDLKDLYTFCLSPADAKKPLVKHSLYQYASLYPHPFCFFVFDIQVHILFCLERIFEIKKICIRYSYSATAN